MTAFCCASHVDRHEGDGVPVLLACCDRSDCGPCCAKCPTCPTVRMNRRLQEFGQQAEMATGVLLRRLEAAPKVTSDPEAGAIYIRVRDGEVANTGSVLNVSCNVDRDAEGRVLGIEFLGPVGAPEHFVGLVDGGAQ